MINCVSADTIAAIATPIGESGIGIVRISGKETLRTADKIFVSKDGRKPSGFKTYTTHYGWIVDSLSPLTNKDEKTSQRVNEKTNIIDEVILTVMRAPRSYTKEDVVEINCHGGIIALRKVLDLVLSYGCRLAEPGEFTQRAFLNGRIDLAQAEAVLDIIRAKTDSALRVGLEQLEGGLSKKINAMRSQLLEILTLLESQIDFPEEETSSLDLAKISCELKKINRDFSQIIAGAAQGRLLREGLRAVICGKPNVGKSSLLNALLKQERSIVTPIPGTTRDTIEEIIDIKGIPVRIVDTAGILEPRDLIEKKALQRTRKYIAAADLVILVFDGSQKLSRQDKILMRKIKNKNIIALINKMDLRQRLEKEVIRKTYRYLLSICAKKGRNLNLLEDAIVDLVYRGKIASSESCLVTNLRHLQMLKRAQKSVAEAKNSLDNKLPVEIIAHSLKEALGNLDELLGKRFSEDLLARIFSDFCIGK